MSHTEKMANIGEGGVAWFRYENYNRLAIVFGICQVVCGLFSFALGISSICTLSTGYFIGYGIWCGVVFAVSGVIAIMSATQTNCMVTTTLVISIIAACCAAAQFSLGVVAASADHFYQLGDRTKVTALLCNHSSSLSWEGDFGPIDVLLLLLGGIEGVFAIINAALCCIATCRGIPVRTFKEV